ncbi:hypothetical protein AgCh_021198 [Apium graveolens]
MHDIAEAQKLRYKVLEFIVKNVLSQIDVAEFLVAFAGIQDSIPQISRDQRMLKVKMQSAMLTAVVGNIQHVCLSLSLLICHDFENF